MLPLDYGPIRYPLPVGNTPLIAAPTLRDHLRLPKLWLKDETRSPTGSNKDRATALVVEQAMRSGADTVTCASMGNVAVSLAVGAAAAGLRSVVYVPATVEPARLTLMLMAGAQVVKVEEGYAAAFERSRADAERNGWVDRNTGVNPATVAAKKTVAFEVWEQLGRQVPDVAVIPVGDGPTICAFAEGFRELRDLGHTASIPRLIGVQAEGCQPVRMAWKRDEPLRPVEAATFADGIAVGDPISGAAAIRDVRESGGAFVAVSDDELLAAMDQLIQQAGIIAEPAGAAATAGLHHALAGNLVSPGETCVVLVTGTGLKTPRYLSADRAEPRRRSPGR